LESYSAFSGADAIQGSISIGAMFCVLASARSTAAIKSSIIVPVNIILNIPISFPDAALYLLSLAAPE